MCFSSWCSGFGFTNAIHKLVLVSVVLTEPIHHFLNMHMASTQFDDRVAPPKVIGTGLGQTILRILTGPTTHEDLRDRLNCGGVRCGPCPFFGWCPETADRFPARPRALGPFSFWSFSWRA